MDNEDLDRQFHYFGGGQGNRIVYHRYTDHSYSLIGAVQAVRPVVLMPAKELNESFAEGVIIAHDGDLRVATPGAAVALMAIVQFKDRPIKGGLINRRTLRPQVSPGHEGYYLVDPTGYCRLIGMVGADGSYYFIEHDPGGWNLTRVDRDKLNRAIAEIYGQ